MSKYGTEYRLSWLTAATNVISPMEIRVSIFKTSHLIDDSDTVNVINLTPAASPLDIDTVNNDKNKFQAIRTKQATIRFISKSLENQSISTFCDYPDNEWYVEIIYVTSGAFIFKGFLMLSDMQQNLLPDPNIVELIASDHLALLRDLPLTDFNGDNPIGKYKIGEIIAMCLKRTGLSLNINVINNLRHGYGVFILNNGAIFFASSSSMIFSGLYGIYFYEGQQVTISGTASNDGTYIVKSVTTSIFGFFSGIVFSSSVVDESCTTPITFTDNSSSGHFYDKISIDSKTFESEVNECEDCYSVLEKILSYDSFITQYLGEWHILRIDEFDNNTIYRAIFNSSGIYQSIGAVSLGIDIGRNEDLKFANADNIILPDRPYKYVRLTYNYKYPIEVFCNIDFSRGDYLDDVNPYEKRYEIDCWDLKHGMPGSTDGNYGGVTAYIHRKFNQSDNEIEKYIVLTPKSTFETSSSDSVYIQSSPLYINSLDKFTASIQWRLPSKISTGGHNQRLFRFVLNGDDGSWWILGRPSDTGGSGDDLRWYDTALFTTNTARGITVVDYDVIDEDTWQTISWEAPPVPVSGSLYCWINQYNQHNDANDNTEVWYTSFNFEYIPLINGSYRKTTGHYNQVTRAINADKYSAKIEDDVFIGDSPRKLFKGAMFTYAGGVYYLSKNFYSSAQFALGSPTNISFIKPYGWHQIQAVWNQYVNNSRYFNGTVLGFGANLPDMINKFSLTDTNPNTNNRYFVLISVNQNWRTQQWVAMLSEVYNSVSPRVYTDTYLLKYLIS